MTKINDLEEGMTLAQDVMNLHGQMIVPKGLKLEARHIRVLKAWGVPSVVVNEASVEDSSQNILSKVPPAQLEELKNQLKDIFHDTNSEDIFIRALFQICLERKAARVLGKVTHASRT